MPVPHSSGAALQPIPLTSPAFRGLNKQAESSILGVEWATKATNAVFDSAGRLAARKGWSVLTTTPMSGTPTVEQIHVYIKKDGTSQIISAAGSKLWRDTTAPTDITGTATVTVGNNWQFVNFNDLVLGFQAGEQPIVYNGSTTFSDLVAASGTAPKGNCAISAFGRIWAADSDKQTIKYSALLDHTKWAVADGAGSIDMSSVWPNGTDEVVGLAAYNGLLVIFGRNNVVFYGDGTGSALGINPANIFVTDTITGVGLYARDTVQQIESGDMLFLSRQGIQSLQRLIQERSNPIDNVTKNVRDYFIQYFTSETNTLIRSVYSPQNNFYLLACPSLNFVLCVDTKGKMEDGTFRATEWDTTAWRALANHPLTGAVYAALSTVGGRIGTYDGYIDYTTPYSFDYESGWLDLGVDAALYLKMLKTLSGIFFISSATSLNLKWYFDFDNTVYTRPFSVTATGSSEWNVFEWGIGTWSGGLSLRNVSAPASGTGRYIKVGAQALINNSAFAIQQINLFAKLGRMAA